MSSFKYRVTCIFTDSIRLEPIDMFFTNPVSTGDCIVKDEKTFRAFAITHHCSYSEIEADCTTPYTAKPNE